VLQTPPIGDPMHCMFVVHPATQRAGFAVVSHTIPASPQSVLPMHCTHWPAGEHVRSTPVVHCVSDRQATQALVVVLQ
jgi:hypothetical protein